MGNSRQTQPAFSRSPYFNWGRETGQRQGEEGERRMKGRGESGQEGRGRGKRVGERGGVKEAEGGMREFQNRRKQGNSMGEQLPGQTPRGTLPQQGLLVCWAQYPGLFHGM